MLSLQQVIEATGGTLVGPGPDNLGFSGAAIDSRKVREGTLFIALRGQKHDGHLFVAEALAAGARAALVEYVPADCLWASDPRAKVGPPLVVVPSTQAALEAMARYLLQAQSHLTVIGVTGSLGKTTTKEVVAETLGARFRVLKTEGNFNSEIGLPLTLLNNLAPSDQVAVLEMGMYGIGDIRFLARLTRPQFGIVTNVHAVHLERLGSIDRIQQAKQELVEELPETGAAILNLDDPRVAQMANATKARVVGYGISAEAAVRATNITSQGLRGVEFSLASRGHHLHVHLPLLGAHSVHAALAAAAAALEFGFTLGEVGEAFQNLSPSLRLVVLNGVNGSRIIDDSYNASPESVLAALNLLQELPGRRKIAVLGDMLELGSAEEAGHRLVGNRAARVLHLLITVGPRARIIAREAKAARLPQENVIEATSLDEVVDLLRLRLRPGDDLLVKGSNALNLQSVVQALRAGGES